MRESSNGNDQPLGVASLHILLALSEGELHGYAIMQAVKQQSDGRYKVGPGTLYDNLARLLGKGLVAERQHAQQSGDMRREYRLTGDGESVLREEVRRLAQIVQTARQRLGVLDTGKA